MGYPMWSSNLPLLLIRKNSLKMLFKKSFQQPSHHLHQDLKKPLSLLIRKKQLLICLRWTMRLHQFRHILGSTSHSSSLDTSITSAVISFIEVLNSLKPPVRAGINFFHTLANVGLWPLPMNHGCSSKHPEWQVSSKRFSIYFPQIYPRNHYLRQL